MIMIACVDEKNGMMFNRRRQSRDSVVCRDILRECGGRKLYMSAYSGRLFEEAGSADIRICEEVPAAAAEGDACFMEDIRMTGFEDRIRAVILYKWNRRYPADLYFPLDMSDGAWELQQREEFRGSSHDKVTKEVYKRIK